MRIAFVASEAYPFAKVGGLGDVVGSLPRHLVTLGFEVSVLLPWYEGIEARPAGSVRFRFAGNDEEAPLGEATQGGVRFVFIGLADFRRDRFYGYPDDVRRFVRFSLAAARAAAADVVHAHDWQAALLPVLVHAGLAAGPTRTVLTVHNVAHQGRWNAHDVFTWAGLPWSYFHMEGLEFWGDANILKGGMVCADRITTVSPTYAREIQSPAFGEGLDGVLRRHAAKLTGVLNGIDTDVWDPAHDPHIAAPFSAASPDGKAACREALRDALGIEGPILGAISRLRPQKGLDVVSGGLPQILDLGYSLAVLGRGDADQEEAFARLARAHPRRVHYARGQDEALAHRIYAGADAVLMPSRFEPCGLVQMIAQRYGASPIARAVGGLIDTVEDGRTGILFRADHAEGLIAAVCRFLHHPDPEAMRLAGMRRDFSWDRSAREYARLYREIVA